MARAIKTTHPAVNSFVFLTPEEAFKKFGAGFSLVGRPFTPPAPAGAQPLRAGAAAAPNAKTKKRTKK